MSGSAGPQGQRSGRFLGSLKDALVAASREDTGRQEVQRAPAAAAPSDVIAVAGPEAAAQLPPPSSEGGSLSAAEAAREARTPRVTPESRHVEADSPPTTRVVRAAKQPEPVIADDARAGKDAGDARGFRSGSGRRLAGGCRRRGHRAVPADLRGQQLDGPLGQQSHRHRFRR